MAERRELLPSEVVRVLATHGPLALTVGNADHEPASARCLCAPYEECLYLFIRPDSPVERKLLWDCRAAVDAINTEAGYSVRLRGRAVAGPRVMSHGRRLELIHWLPADANPRVWMVVPFYAERVEYNRGRGDDRFVGDTPAGRDVPSLGSRWYYAAFDGIQLWSLASAIGLWIVTIVAGAEWPLRALAQLMATVAALLLMASGRLWYQARLLLSAREGRGEAPGAPMFDQGLLAPMTVLTAAGVFAVIAAILILVLPLWSWTLFGATLFFSFAWIQWPVWITRIFRAEPAPGSDD